MRYAMQDLVVKIATGESSQQKESLLSRTARTEEGLMTWATLIAVVLFCALIAMVFNVGRIANDKLEAQNAADSTAYSASLVRARAMNAITATNHMMGELTALYTMHHAIGGKVLDDGKTMNNTVVSGLNLALVAIHKAAWAAYLYVIPIYPPGVGYGIAPASYGPANDIPRGEATVYDAKCLLKLKIIKQYAKHLEGTWDILKGKGLLAAKITFPAGVKLVAQGYKKRMEANTEIGKLVREYRFINRLERFAIGSLTVKKQIIPAILAAMWKYEQLIASGTGLACDRTAKSIADRNMCVGEAVGRPGISSAVAMSCNLPIVKDPTTTRKRNENKTQLMRSTYPWVQEWRWKILGGFLLIVPKSGAARFYEYHSDIYCKEICEDFYNKKQFRLYVLEEVDASRESTDKGNEKWRDNSASADRLFCLVGFARQQTPPANTHLIFFPNTNPTPIMSMAQAIIYNGNRPKKWEAKPGDVLSKILGREPQPVPAWDTLNWTEGATEWKNGKSYFGWFGRSMHWVLGDIPFPSDVRILDRGTPEPKIKLNWQTKLVPIAPRNLVLRIGVIHDSEMAARARQQLLPAIFAHQLKVKVIHH